MAPKLHTAIGRGPFLTTLAASFFRVLFESARRTCFLWDALLEPATLFPPPTVVGCRPLPILESDTDCLRFRFDPPPLLLLGFKLLPGLECGFKEVVEAEDGGDPTDEDADEHIISLDECLLSFKCFALLEALLEGGFPSLILMLNGLCCEGSYILLLLLLGLLPVLLLPAPAFGVLLLLMLLILLLLLPLLLLLFSFAAALLPFSACSNSSNGRDRPCTSRFSLIEWALHVSTRMHAPICGPSTLHILSLSKTFGSDRFFFLFFSFSTTCTTVTALPGRLSPNEA